MSWSVSTQQQPLRILPQLEFNPETKEEQSNPEIDLDVNSPPNSTSNGEKVNDLYSCTYREKEWPLKREVKKHTARKTKNPDESKKIEILPYVQVQPSSGKSLNIGQVRIVKGSYNKSQKEEEKLKYFEDKQYSSVFVDHSKFYLNQIPSDFQYIESKKSDNRIFPYNREITKLASEGRIEDCYEIINILVQKQLAPDLYSYNPIFNGLIQAGRYEEARDLLGQMQYRGIRPDQSTCNTFMKIHVKYGDPNGARALMDEMWQNSVKPDLATYNTLMKIYAMRRDLDGARALLVEMKDEGIKPDAITYTPLVGYFLDAGNLDEAWELFEEMKRENVELDEKICLIFLVLFLKKGILKYCGPLLKEMELAGIKPEIPIYNALRDLYHAEIRYCIDNQQLTKSAELFEEMDGAGIALDVTSYNIILDCYVRYGIIGNEDLQEQVQDSHGYLKRLLIAMGLEQIKPDKETYELLMQYYLQIGNPEGARNLFAQMLKAGILPDKKTYAILHKLNEVEGKLQMQIKAAYHAQQRRLASYLMSQRKI